MATIIGDVALARDPLWTDYGKRQDVIGTVDKAISGVDIITERARVGGYPITLQCTRETGWITGTELAGLRLQAAKTRERFVLNYRGTIIQNVRYMNERSGGAIDMSPLHAQADPTSSTTLFVGTIYLMTTGA